LKRASTSRWPATIQTALVPLSIGLMAASALILARTSDLSWMATLITIVAALFATFTRLSPLWMMAAGGLLGFAGVI
jgi:chromate transporter